MCIRDRSKAFDNGMICASEQAVIVDKEIYDDVKDQFKNYNVHYANKKEKEMLEQYMFGVKAFTKNVGAAKLNPDIVGKSAAWIAERAGFTAVSYTQLRRRSPAQMPVRPRSSNDLDLTPPLRRHSPGTAHT